MVQCQLVISLSDLRYISLSRLSAVSTLCRGDEGCHQDFFIAKISGRQTCECWMCCVIKLGTKTRNIHLGLHSLFYTFLCYFRIRRQVTYDKFYYLLILRQGYVLCVRKRRSGQFIMTLFYLRVSAGIKHILKLKLFFGAAVHLLMEYFEILVFLEILKYFLVKASIKLF